MSKNKRKPRPEGTPADFSKPIDITQFGSDNDPCFGKLYDLSTEECRRCGDSELCGLIFAQKGLKKKRLKQEKNNRYKDLELTKNKTQETLEHWVKIKKEEGKTRRETIKAAREAFGSTREEIKRIWKDL